MYFEIKASYEITSIARKLNDTNACAHIASVVKVKLRSRAIFSAWCVPITICMHEIDVIASCFGYICANSFNFDWRGEANNEIWWIRIVLFSNQPKQIEIVCGVLLSYWFCMCVCLLLLLCNSCNFVCKKRKKQQQQWCKVARVLASQTNRLTPLSWNYL